VINPSDFDHGLSSTCQPLDHVRRIAATFCPRTTTTVETTLTETTQTEETTSTSTSISTILNSTSSR